MSDRESFEKWFAGLRDVSVDIIQSMRSGDGYESFCVSLDGIYLAWASWKASKNNPAYAGLSSS